MVDVARETGVESVELPMLGMGQLTVLMGDPGVGKSMVALDLAARVTRNSLMPPMPLVGRENFEVCVNPEIGHMVDHCAGSVAVLSGEDSVETVCSRMVSAGANMEMVYMPENLLTLVPERYRERRDRFQVRRELEESPLVGFLRREFVRVERPRVLVLDPLSHFLGASDISSASRVRQLLYPLLRAAEGIGFAVIGVMHLNKSRHQRGVLQRAMGSMAYVAMARAVYLVTRDYQDRESGLHDQRRLVLPIKTNLAAVRHGLGFHITERRTVAWEAEAVWEHPLLTGKDCGEELGEDAWFARTRLEFAKGFLREALAKGAVRTLELEREAREAGVAKRTLERARLEMGVETRKTGEGWVVSIGQ